MIRCGGTVCRQSSKHASKFRSEKLANKKTGQQTEKVGDYHRFLFGTTDESCCILFHDAWYVPDSDSEPLKMDVMTPHHQDWNDDGKAPPTDFDSPAPVPFLSVSGSFLFSLSWYGPDIEEEKKKKWLELMVRCLREALFEWGVGGKTSSGYGRFNREIWSKEKEKNDKEAEEKRIAAEKEAKLTSMSPIERSIEEFLESKKTDSAPKYTKLIYGLKDSRWTDDDERKAVARYVKLLMQEGDGKPWKGKGKDGDRKTFIQQILGEI
ncbi:MAG: type III-B CRISPR module RAMP protein Cmr6 [Zavarzinella sp.]